MGKQHRAGAPHSLSGAFEALRREIREALGAGHAPSKWVRLEKPIPTQNILGLLRQCPAHGDAFYWCDRDGHGEWAAWGVAREWVLKTDVPDFLRPLLEDLKALPEGVRLGGGWAMDPLSPRDENWEAFGGGRFWAPLLEWGRRGKAHYLAVNLAAGAHTGPVLETIEALFASLEAGEPPMPILPQGKVLDHDPVEETWLSRVETVLREIAGGSYRKIILSRKTRVDMGEGADPAAYLGTRVHPDLDVFLLRRGASTYWGMTPERLLSRDHERVWSEALAGTRPRGQSPADDQRLEGELFNSEKDRREQDFVREFIERTLGPWCAAVQVGQTQVRKFRSVQHLYTPFHGRLKDAAHFPDLAGALHPTPAVAIFQKERSLEAIRALEGFDRGWYGGVAGWLARDRCELAVGIRSCLSIGNTWTFWTGAGIVEGSHGHREWHELDQKLVAYGDLLVTPGAHELPA